MDRQISITYDKIVSALNESGLPAGVGVLILKDIYNNVNELYKQSLQEEDKVYTKTETYDVNDLVSQEQEEEA